MGYWITIVLEVILLFGIIVYIFRKSYTGEVFRMLRKILRKQIEIAERFLRSEGKILRDVMETIDRIEKEYREAGEKIARPDVQSVVYELILRVISETGQRPDSKKYEAYYNRIFRFYVDKRIQLGL